MSGGDCLAVPQPAAAGSLSTALEPTKLISQSNLQRLWAQLDRYEFLEYADWEKIITVWFVRPAKRRQTLELVRWARAGRIFPDPKSDPDELQYKLGVDPWDSIVGPDYPVWCVPGLAEHLKGLTLDQIGEDMDELRAAGLGLDVQGYRASMFRNQPLDAHDLDSGAFIRGARPGKPITITGNPDDGKTDFAMNYIAAPALKAGWVVVANVRVRNPPPNYIYVKTFAQALAAAIGARLDGHTVLLLRDEGGSNRARQAATSRDAQTQKQGSMQVYRKLDIIEVFMIQNQPDLPREVISARDRWFHKLRKTVVDCHTPTLKGIVTEIQTTKQLQAQGRPFLDYDTRDFSPFEIDANIIAVLEHEFGRRDVAWEVHVGAIKERLERIADGPIVREPLTLVQLKRLITRNHLEDTRTSPVFFFRFFQQDWLVNGVSNIKVLHELMKSEWGIWSHPTTLGKACKFCLGNHPELKLEAAKASAARPPETLTPEEAEFHVK